MIIAMMIIMMMIFDDDDFSSSQKTLWWIFIEIVFFVGELCGSKILQISNRFEYELQIETLRVVRSRRVKGLLPLNNPRCSLLSLKDLIAFDSCDFNNTSFPPTVRRTDYFDFPKGLIKFRLIAGISQYISENVFEMIPLFPPRVTCLKKLHSVHGDRTVVTEHVSL